MSAVCGAAILAALWLTTAPQTADLAAQTYRSQLFARQGFALWDNSWFAGHHIPGYSLLFPALSVAVGSRTLAIAAVMASAALFAVLVRDLTVGRRRAIAWFACAVAGDLFIGRLTFALGVACALACLVAVSYRRPRLAIALGALTAAASPVSALLLTLVLLAWLPPLGRGWRAAVIAAPAGIAALLALTFPEGGIQPYDLGAAAVALAITVAVGLAISPTLPQARRGALLYALAIVASYVIPSPMGSNVARLGVLAAGPLLMLGVGADPERWKRVLIALAVPTIFLWQLWGPVTEVLKASDAPATSAAYFRPLIAELATRPAGRLEVVPTSTRWESVYVAPHRPLARGWETQLDRRYDGLFYAQKLDPAAYLRWLRNLGVSYIALSDAPAERWGKNEAALLTGGGVPALRPLWHSRHWRLFGVAGAAPIVSRGRLLTLRSDVVEVALPTAGTVLIRVRYTRFWQAGADACVSRSAAGFTLLHVTHPGTYALRASLDWRSLLGSSDREGCAARTGGAGASGS